MPRIIRNCRHCTIQFIAEDFLIDLVCLNCKQSEKEKADDYIQPTQQESDAGVNSEAEDDFHCTQIIDLISSDDDHEDEDEPLTNLIRPACQKQVYNPYSQSKPAAQKPQHLPNKEDKATETIVISLQPPNAQKHQTSQQLTTCCVCGANLLETIQGWKGRLDHIKRCSKKHGVQAKDIIEQQDEDFVVVDVAAQAGNWHGDALKGSATMQKTTMLVPQTKEPAPRNALAMLMDGARRVAQEAKLPKQPKEAKQSWKQNDNRKRQWTSGPTHANRACPSYKKIPGTDFDGFQYATPALTSNYFLTHFHSDHYGGIARQWDTGIIYCSEPTASLVNQQLGVDRQYLHPLPVGVPVPITTGNGKTISVTLYNANHCPGAIMLLFQVDKRNIMHVGDFRWHRQQMAVLGEQFRIDDLFLDTTYCDPKYVLPTQAEAIQAAVEMAVREAHKYAKLRLLLVFGAYTIGKERIYLSVARQLNKKVYVDRRRFRVLQAVLEEEDLQWITTDPEGSMLWVVPLGHVNMKKLHMYLSVKVGKKERVFDKVVGFRPTGWSLAKGTIITTAARSNLTVHSVPYSEHSSFPELVDCITCWRPQRIIPTVSVSKSQQQVDLLLSHLDK